MPGAIRAFGHDCRFKASSVSSTIPGVLFRGRFSRCHSNGGPIQAAKNVFYRVSGLPRGAKSDDVRQFIKNSTATSEPDLSPDIEILPACVQGFRDTTSIAIVRFRRDQEPLFLRQL